MDADGLLRPVNLQPLEGLEPLGPATVLDFWRWALGDLRMNTARGYLVEFLVARALGDPSRVRVEWGPYDVEAADGTRVEVKATGRLQSWATRALSTPTWTFKSVRAASVWSEELGVMVDVEPEKRVHAWVFALHTTVDPAQYDPLDIAQWEFRVMAHRELFCVRSAQREALFLRSAPHRPRPVRGARRGRCCGPKAKRRARRAGHMSIA